MRVSSTNMKPQRSLWKILFLHGWHSVVGGIKPTFFKNACDDVINPKPDDDDFDAAVATAQAEFDEHQLDVIVGSSRGGAIAMNITSSDGYLRCPTDDDTLYPYGENKPMKGVQYDITESASLGALQPTTRAAAYPLAATRDTGRVASSYPDGSHTRSATYLASPHVHVIVRRDHPLAIFGQLKATLFSRWEFLDRHDLVYGDKAHRSTVRFFQCVRID